MTSVILSPALNRLNNTVGGTTTISDTVSNQGEPFIVLNVFNENDSKTIDTLINNGQNGTLTNLLCFLENGSLIERVAKGSTSIQTYKKLSQPNSSNYIYQSMSDDGSGITSMSDSNIVGTNAVFKSMKNIVNETPLTGINAGETIANSEFFVSPDKGLWLLQRYSNPTITYKLLYNPINRFETMQYNYTGSGTSTSGPTNNLSNFVSGNNLLDNNGFLSGYCNAINFADPICFSKNFGNNTPDYCTYAVFGSASAAEAIQQADPSSYQSASNNCACFNAMSGYWASNGNDYVKNKTAAGACPNQTITICNTSLNANNGGSIDAKNMAIAQNCTTNVSKKVGGGGGGVQPVSIPRTPSLPDAAPNGPPINAPSGSSSSSSSVSKPTKSHTTMIVIGVVVLLLLIVIGAVIFLKK
jgi:hypothetical protein